MKKIITALALIIVTPLYAQNHQWVMTKNLPSSGNEASLAIYIDISNPKIEGNFRYFWQRFEMIGLFNPDGTRFNRTHFGYIKVDCKKRIYTNTFSQTFIGSTLTESEVKNLHWNILDINNPTDISILRYICN